MLKHVMAGIAAAALSSTLYGLFLVLRSGFSASTAIPIAGMLLGNATSGVSVALSTVLTGLRDGAAAVEARLAMGATRWEATNELLRNAIRTGLTPVLNQMSIIGLVSIPGAKKGETSDDDWPANNCLQSCIKRELF